MTQITLKIEKPSVLQLIKKLISELDGVTIVKTKRRKTGIDLALEDIKAGRLNRAENVDDLMKQLMAD